MRISCAFLFVVCTVTSYSQTTEIYVSDAGNFNNPPWQILKFDEFGGNPEVFIDDHLNWPQDILFLEESNTVLISNLGSGLITRHNSTDGTYLDDFAKSIDGPTRIKIGPDSLLYVLQWKGDGKVLRFELDGTALGPFTESGVSQSIGLDWDNEGNLYVSSYNGDLVRKFDQDGKDLGGFITSNLAGPTNIWFHESGDLMVSDYDATAIKRFDIDGKYVGDFITGLSNSEGVAFFENGDLLIGNGKTSAVKLYNSEGTFIRDFVETRGGGLKTPNAVTIRKTVASGVRKDKLEAPILLKGSGSHYRINPEFSDDIVQISTYELSGKLAHQGDIHDFAHQSLPAGIYIVGVEFLNGSVRQECLVLP